ncbi:Reverse transcriptase zinc-binding domain [Sesbania bispinosa]|nr:Reverse transcriptase zinc-binding domain [Sesbania bispinosa]
MEQISGLLPQWILSHIYATIPPNDGLGQDRISWSLTPDGSFTVCSAYNHNLGIRDHNGDPFWKHLWKMNCPQRVWVFCWTYAYNGLKTNVFRARRDFTHDDTCPICGREPETQLHILRDCMVVKQVWLLLLSNNQATEFFNLPLQTIWLERNNVVFSNKHFEPERIAQLISYRAHNMEASMANRILNSPVRRYCI